MFSCALSSKLLCLLALPCVPWALPQVPVPRDLPLITESIDIMQRGPYGQELSKDHHCEWFCQIVNTWFPVEILEAGHKFMRVQVSVYDHPVRFIVVIQLHDTDCSPLRNGVQLGCHVLPDGCCVRLVAQRVGKTQVSERGLYGRRMLMDGDYCQVFSNTFKTWVTGTILDQGPDFWRVCFHHNHLQDCEKVTFPVPEQMTVLSLNLD